MKKRRLAAVRWIALGLRDALRHPPTDRMAKFNAGTWAVLVLVVMMNATMALLLGTVSAFLICFTAMGLVAYPVFLRWSLDGLAYRRSERVNKVFAEIVKNAQD